MFGILIKLLLYILDLFGTKEGIWILKWRPRLKPKLQMNFSTQAKQIVIQEKWAVQPFPVIT